MLRGDLGPIGRPEYPALHAPHDAGLRSEEGRSKIELTWRILDVDGVGVYPGLVQLVKADRRIEAEAGGRFRAPLYPEETALVQAPGFADTVHHCPAPNRQGEVVLTVKRPSAFDLIVVDSDGAPWAGCVLELKAPDGTIYEGLECGADGRYQGVLGTHAEMSIAKLRWNDRAAIAFEPKPVVAGRTVVVRVEFPTDADLLTVDLVGLNEQGEAVPLTKVTARIIGGADAKALGPVDLRVDTQGVGHGVLARGPRWRLTVAALGYSPRVLEWSASEPFGTRERVEVVLAETRSLQGRVVRSIGGPAGRGAVQIMLVDSLDLLRVDPKARLRIRPRLSPTGEFSMSGLVAGEYLAYYYSEDGIAGGRVVNLQEPRQEPITILAEPAGTLRLVAPGSMWPIGYVLRKPIGSEPAVRLPITRALVQKRSDTNEQVWELQLPAGRWHWEAGPESGHADVLAGQVAEVVLDD